VSALYRIADAFLPTILRTSSAFGGTQFPALVWRQQRVFLTFAPWRAGLPALAVSEGVLLTLSSLWINKEADTHQWRLPKDVVCSVRTNSNDLYEDVLFCGVLKQGFKTRVLIVRDLLRKKFVIYQTARFAHAADRLLVARIQLVDATLSPTSLFDLHTGVRAFYVRRIRSWKDLQLINVSQQPGNDRVR
jgi:hypothetical protein